MKRILTLSLLACGVCLGAQAQTALATKSAVVSAQVLDTCKFSGAASQMSLSLGQLDPSQGDAKTNTRTIDFFCTNGYAVEVGIAGQTGPLLPRSPRVLTHKADATQTVPYTLAVALPNGTTGKGFGTGNQLTLSLTTELDANTYVDALRGDYEDTLVVELRP